MIKFIKRYLRLFDRLLYTALEDFGSLRNKLIIITGIFCYMSLKTVSQWGISATLAAWTVILTFYFQKRQESDNNGNSSNKPSRYDKEVKRDRREDTAETFEEGE